jgi:hypothetical protein
MSRNTARERGEGRVGFLISVIVVAIAIFLGMKIIPVRIDAYEFRDHLREEARYAAVRHDDKTVATRIMQKAKELQIPLDRKNLKIKRSVGEIIISASYEQPIDLKVTTYVYRFNEQQKAPLF